jgi:hypothetical protein
MQVSRKLKVALVVTLAFMAFQFVGGYITGRCDHMWKHSLTQQSTAQHSTH